MRLAFRDLFQLVCGPVLDWMRRPDDGWLEAQGSRLCCSRIFELCRHNKATRYTPVI